MNMINSPILTLIQTIEGELKEMIAKKRSMSHIRERVHALTASNRNRFTIWAGELQGQLLVVTIWEREIRENGERIEYLASAPVSSEWLKSEGLSERKPSAC